MKEGNYWIVRSGRTMTNNYLVPELACLRFVEGKMKLVRVGFKPAPTSTTLNAGEMSWRVSLPVGAGIAPATGENGTV